ncbi:deoxyribodipyrimidine photo-lyase [Candidatus Nanohaloarchaea archaeon]|nr:deoxyribodipyrimidine photo-lyase [Candidatus Nanohaloarchaea archaeon]
MTAIVWIRRSLREHDNTALVEALEEHERVIPFYVVDENYFSNAALGYPRVKFWHDSLEELKDNLANQEQKDLVIREGSPVDELEKIVEEADADAVYHNKDYSPYARERDEKAAEKLDVPVNSFKDIVMFEEKEILTNSDTPYKVYTYYSKKWFEKEKRRPREVKDYTTPDIESDEIPSLEELGYEKPEDFTWEWKPGREGAKERLEAFKEKIWNYDENRDYAWKDSTSKLSPHLKFGTVSIREVFWEAERLKARNPDADTSGIKTWQEELAWRDFYMQVLYNWPETVEKPFLEQYEDIEWRSKEEAEEDWKAFINGKTGYPFVDAGMRQLKKTGWMHNRLRMVVTSFACKDLWLDWKDLHEYFKKMFVDAEKASMIGGIQWAYSIGTDAQPYFRVFNPFSQGEDYDPDGEYIRKWVPELSEVPDEDIHRPHEMSEEKQAECGVEIGEDYPKPIVDHGEKREEAIEKFEEARED